MSDDLDFGNTLQGFAPGQKLSKRYSLNRTLGEGGMGVVWLVRDEELRRDIAMKFLPEMVVKDREAIADLKRETNRSLELTHSNIVRIYDFVQEANWAGISMEYVDGDTLSALKIEEPAGCFDVEQITPWIEQLCQALSYAHEEAQVVHRDLKPTNLMVTKTGKLKVTDFGISGTLSESMSRVSVRTSSSAGTLVYMSPQQAMGEPPSATDDIYSLGATVYDLLTGKPPFYSGDVITQVREKPPTPLAERRTRLEVAGKQKIPPHWEATILACLKKDPKDRPQSVREVAERLFQPSAFSTMGLPSLPNLGETVAKLPVPPRGKLVAAGVAGLAVLGALIGAVLHFQHPKVVPVKPVVVVTTPTPAPSVAPQIVKVVPATPAPSAIPVAVATPTAAPVAIATPIPAASATPAPSPSLEALDSDKLLQLAQSGNASAQGLAGLWYAAGYKFPQDYKQSLEWAGKAAGAGDPVGQFALALLYSSGNGGVLNSGSATGLAGEAVPKFSGMAGQNAADYCIAKAYELGLGIQRDQQKALALFEKQAGQAGQNNALSQYAAGWMYANGEGTAQDFQKAGEFFQEAANQGHADALAAMALLYQDGKGVAQDADKALELWQQAADRGSVQALQGLGLMDSQGYGGTAKDLQKAAGYYQKAADQGSAAGLYGLGWMNANGQGTSKDLQKAAGFYQQAADAGFAPADAALALAYAAGRGVASDPAKASDLYRSAAANPAGPGVSVAAEMAPPLASVLEHATDAQSPTDDASAAAAATPSVGGFLRGAANDPLLTATWETTGTAADGTSKKTLWKIAKDGKYTITGAETDSGTVSGCEGYLQQLSASATQGVPMSYAIDGSTMETYGPQGLVKWRHQGTGESTSTHRRSNSSDESSGSGGGIGHKIKKFFTFGHG